MSFHISAAAALTSGLAFMSLFTLGAVAQTVPGFLSPTAYKAGTTVTAVAVGDLNGDAIPDLVTSNNGSHNISILLGKADGTFKPAANVALSGSPLAITLGDFNGDGKLDVAVTNNGSISILLGHGDGTVGPATDIALSDFAFGVTTGDVNGDGLIDLAVSVTNNVVVLAGKGDGTFAITSTLPVSGANGSVVLADFNNDGRLDLVAQSRTAVSMFLGNGDGTFIQQANIGSSPGPMAAGDFNGDGKLDLAISYVPLSFGDPGSLSIYLGNGDGTFGLFPFGIGLGKLLGPPVVGDFNSDGKLDVAVKLGTATPINLMLGNGDGTIQAPTLIETGNALSTNLAVRDLDRNGSTDFVLANGNSNNVLVLRNTMGNPPLLALTSLNPSSVVGGAATSVGTVFLGGPAPSTGASVSLTSSNPSVAFFPNGSVVKIPANANSATFTINTAAASAASSSVISASYHSVTQSATLSVVPSYSVASVSLNPASQFGIFTTTGTVTLTGPADSSAVVSLSSTNTAIATTPATVTVPAGTTSATFTVGLQPVTVDTPVTISAVNGGVTKSATLTVLKPLDSLTITRAEYTVRQSNLRVEATTTGSNPTLTLYNATTGQLIGTMINGGGGKYSRQLTVTPAVTSVTLKSTLGGTITGSVTQK